MHITTPSSRTTALVLGGGGSTGNAWLIGVVAGLAQAGLDVTDADLTVGTSAGATAAAQLTVATPAQLFSDTLAAAPQPRRAAVGPGRMTDHLARLSALVAASTDPADLRRRVGAAALEKHAASDGSGPDRWRSVVAARLPGARWPARHVLITAVDAQTGDPVTFDQDSGVDLVDAVAASTSGGGTPYAIGGRWYVDGGYRSNPDNADLAAGFDRVLVLSPLGGRSLFPREWGMWLEAQVEELRAGGSRVETVVPGSDSEHLFGADAMDVSLRPLAAQAGFDQGVALAGMVTEHWR